MPPPVTTARAAPPGGKEGPVDQFPMRAELYVEHEREATALSWYDARRGHRPVAPTTPADLRTAVQPYHRWGPLLGIDARQVGHPRRRHPLRLQDFVQQRGQVRGVGQ